MNENRLRRRHRRRRRSGETNSLQSRPEIKIGPEFDHSEELPEPTPLFKRIGFICCMIVVLTSGGARITQSFDDLNWLEPLAFKLWILSLVITVPIIVWINRLKIQREWQNILEHF